MMDYLNLKLSEVSLGVTPGRNSKMEMMIKTISEQYSMANMMKMKVKEMIKKEMVNNQEKTLMMMTATSDSCVHLKILYSITIFDKNRYQLNI